ncbi:hypothetical protein ACFL3D_00420 [Candidatus Omnitrophota bacterium]
MILEIGIVAGEILFLLDQADEPLRIENLKYSIDSHPDLVLMALGSIIREGYVMAEQKEGRICITQRGIYEEDKQEESMLLCDSCA